MELGNIVQTVQKKKRWYILYKTLSKGLVLVWSSKLDGSWSILSR